MEPLDILTLVALAVVLVPLAVLEVLVFGGLFSSDGRRVRGR